MTKLLCACLSICFMLACSPSEKKVDSPSAPSNLKYSVSQKIGEDNIVYLKSETPNTIPYWIYTGGTSRLEDDTLIFPFAGDYTIKYGVSVIGQYVQSSDSTNIHVTNTNLGYITDPQWQYLTNTTGKTWKLDMSKPIGWYGTDYIKHNGSSDDWSWTPDYLGNEWVMPNMNYGTMSFDLNGGKNYKIHRISFDGKTTDCSGSFDMSLSTNKMTINGCGLLFGGDYFSQAVNWNNITIIEITNSYMVLAVNRLTSSGGGLIGYRFIPE